VYIVTPIVVVVSVAVVVIVVEIFQRFFPSLAIKIYFVQKERAKYVIDPSDHDHDSRRQYVVPTGLVVLRRIIVAINILPLRGID
jgi:hypothetical protein